MLVFLTFDVLTDGWFLFTLRITCEGDTTAYLRFGSAAYPDFFQDGLFLFFFKEKGVVG